MENLNNKENKIEIKPMGSYFEIDQDGYIKTLHRLKNSKENGKNSLMILFRIYRKACSEHLQTHVYSLAL